MTTTTTPTYRKTKTGEWVAFGPAAQIQVGALSIAKRDGSTKTETIGRVGRTFQSGGVECRYGYIERPAARPERNSRGYRTEYVAPHRFLDEGDGECMECGYHHSHPSHR